MIAITRKESGQWYAQMPLSPTALSQQIADLVSEEMLSVPGIDADTAVARADGRLRPDQRAYLMEFKDAATILGVWYPQVWVDAWLIHLRNNMGYRLVEISICGYAYYEDPITRACVKGTAPPVKKEDEKEAPPPLKKEEEKKEAVASPWLILGIGAGAYFVGKQLLH